MVSKGGGVGVGGVKGGQRNLQYIMSLGFRGILYATPTMDFLVSYC